MVTRVKDARGRWILLRDDVLLSRPLCKHCETRVSSVGCSRGLCNSCRHDPEIRGRFQLSPEMQRYAEKGLGGNIKRLRKPKSPTAAEPGSAEKIEVMQNRVLNGEELHHPLDVKYDVSQDFRPPWEIPVVKDRRGASR